MKHMLWMLLILSGLQISSLVARETSESFIINIYDTYVKVVSPNSASDKVAIIFKNETLSKLRGVIKKRESNYTMHITVDASKFKSVEVPYASNDSLYFQSLAPAFQEVDLIIGKKTYEIPSKK